MGALVTSKENLETVSSNVPLETPFVSSIPINKSTGGSLLGEKNISISIPQTSFILGEYIEDIPPITPSNKSVGGSLLGERNTSIIVPEEPFIIEEYAEEIADTTPIISINKSAGSSLLGENSTPSIMPRTSFTSENYIEETTDITPIIQSTASLLGEFIDTNDKNTKDFYKGTSIRDRGNWEKGVHYFNNEYNTDYIYYKNNILRCIKTHDSTLKNKPVIIYDKTGKPIGIEGDLWVIALSGISGAFTPAWGTLEGNIEDQTDLIDILNEKQDLISDLQQIRLGAQAGVTAYQKPTVGIPKTDLTSSVQSSLDKADTALQEHQSLTAYRKSADQDIIDASKQNIISDLQEIREGSVLGSTAVQDNSYTHTDNNYTTVDKNKLAGIETGAQKNLENTVVDVNYIHTDNNYTTSEKTKLSGIETGAQKNLENTVIDANYTHTDNNYTTTEKNKLAELENYDDTNIINRVSSIEGKIPTQATSINQVADKDFVNSSINSLAAFYITSNIIGDAFATKASLLTGPYYNQGQLRTPTRNDYAIILADETKEDASTRYIFDGTIWAYQYKVNNKPLTEAQVKALNSGITSELRESYSNHVNNISNPHRITKAQIGLGNVENTRDLDKPISTAVSDALKLKQNTITDLDTIRYGSTLGATAYQLPEGGIPKATLAAGVQTSLGKADTALQSGSNISLLNNDTGYVTNAYHDSTKQDVISDLATIRSGAALGATAVQPAALEEVSDRVSNIETKEAVWDAKYNKPTGGIPASDLTNTVQTSLGKADTALQSGSNVSLLNNDAGYLTQHQSLTAYRTAANQNIIDSGKQATLVSGTNIKTINNQSILGSGNIEIQGGGGTSDYNSLSNKPQIEGVELTGNKSARDIGLQSTISDLSAIRSGAEAGATAVQPGDLATVATSGSYTDLTNKPSIPSPANDGKITIKKNGTKVDDFTVNQSANKDIDIAVPTKTSDLTNDSNFYAKPASGIPSTDMTSAVQTSLGKADTAYQKPAGGIPSGHMTDSVQTSLGKADTALQESALNPYRTATAQDAIDLGLSQAIGQVDDKLGNCTTANPAADKAFVNSSIATNTAIFKGTLDAYTDLGLIKPAAHSAIATALNTHTFTPAPTNNDYCFVINADNDSDVIYDRFKATANGSVITWAYEYSLNNSSFTATQWEAINSGVNDDKVFGYDAHLLDTQNPHGVSAEQIGLGQVENTKLSEWGGSTNITKVGTIANGTWNGTKIAKAYLADEVQTSLGKADTAVQPSALNDYVDKSNNQSIAGTKTFSTAIVVDFDTLYDGDGTTSINDKKEDKANKATSWGAAPSDNKYPSEKLVKDSLDTKASASALTSHTSNVSNPHNVTKAQVGLGNVPNTDFTATIQNMGVAIEGKASTSALNAHTGATNNPHGVTKAQVGLGNVDNTSDLNKPISTATQEALDRKADNEQVEANRMDIASIDVDNMGDARAKSIDMDSLPKVCGFDMFKIGNGAPMGLIPEFIGQFYIDKTNGKFYTSSNLSGFSLAPDITVNETVTGNWVFSTGLRVAANKLHIGDATDTLESLLNAKQDTGNIRTSWQGTPDDTHYPSEKLVKDSLDTIADDLGEEVQTRQNQITNITNLIPSQATSSNKLADKEFVNSSISTSTATFRGTVTAANNTEEAAQAALATIATKDLNDYANVLVQNTPSTGLNLYRRYTFNGTAWVFNFDINSTAFTATQWGAINSGISSELVGKTLTTDGTQTITGTKTFSGNDAKLRIDFSKVKTYDGSTEGESLSEVFGTKANATDLTAHTSATNNPHSVTKAQVGLGNVPNTDFTATIQAMGVAIEGKASTSALAAHTGATNNPHGVTKAQVGLGNVPNTDFTATIQSMGIAIETKENSANKVTSWSSTVDNTHYPSEKLVKDSLDAKASTSALTSHTGNTSNPHGVTKAQVGLGNVPNTDFTQTIANMGVAIEGKASTSALNAHTGATNNPHGVTKAQVGLGNVPNTDFTQTIANMSVAIESKENHSNMVTSWQSTPDNTHYPSEKLVKDSIDTKANSDDVYGKSYIDSALSEKANNQDLGVEITERENADKALMDAIADNSSRISSIEEWAKSPIAEDVQIDRLNVTRDINLGGYEVTKAKAEEWDAKANDNEVVKLAGPQTITGNKTFTGSESFTGNVTLDFDTTYMPNGVTSLADRLNDKEETSNKVTSWGATTTNGHYPSEKLVKDSLDAKATVSALSAHTGATNNPHSVTKAQVGLGNVPNTDFTQTIANMGVAIESKEVSSNKVTSWSTTVTDAHYPSEKLVKTALDSKANSADLSSHTGNTSNPHGVTKAQVGLGNVPNTDFTATIQNMGVAITTEITDRENSDKVLLDAIAENSSRIASVESWQNNPNAQTMQVGMLNITEGVNIKGKDLETNLNNCVTKDGAQTITGAKTFTGNVNIQAQFTSQGILPQSNEGFDIGSSSVRWGNLYAAGAIIREGLIVGGENAVTSPNSANGIKHIVFGNPPANPDPYTLYLSTE